MWLRLKIKNSPGSSVYLKKKANKAKKTDNKINNRSIPDAIKNLL